MFKQSDQNFCTRNHYYYTHAVKLNKLFDSIHNGEYSSYFYQNIRLSVGKKPLSCESKVPHILNTLTKAQNKHITEITKLHNQLQRIDCNKKQEIKKMLSSNTLLSDLGNIIIEKIKKTQDEQNLEKQINYLTRELESFNMHIEVCRYLKSQNGAFNALEIVLKYEKAYMQDLYDSYTKQSDIISSYFTNITNDKTVMQSIKIINKYISNHNPQLHNTTECKSDVNDPIYEIVDKNNLSSNIAAVACDDTGNATTMSVPTPRVSIGWSCPASIDNVLKESSSVLGNVHSLDNTDHV